MHISCITRSKWSDLETLKMKPQENNGGGGIVTKYLNVKKCCPEMHFTNDFADPEMRAIMIVEALRIGGTGEGEEHERLGDKLEKLSAQSAIKLLWCEEQAPFRWTGKIRDQIFSKFDAILACNQYQEQLLKVIAPNKAIYTLYTPIDENLYQPTEKKRQVIVAAKIGLQKNTEALIRVFESMPEDVHTVYFGSAGLWGKITNEYDETLEREMASAADEYVKAESVIEVAKRINESLVAINMSIYDVGSLFALESGMAGCYFHAWRYHPMFDEYRNFIRFNNIVDGIPKIGDCLNEKTEPNLLLREELMKKHSYPAFRKQLIRISKEILTSGIS